MKRLLVTLFVTAVVPCWSWAGPVVSSSEPYGIVDLDIPQQAKQLYEVYFLTIDGHNVAMGQSQLILSPGTHVLRMGAHFDDTAVLLHDSGYNRKKDYNVITLDVKDGMRYSLAAHLYGHRGDEWDPVVTKEASYR